MDILRRIRKECLVIDKSRQIFGINSIYAQRPIGVSQTEPVVENAINSTKTIRFHTQIVDDSQFEIFEINVLRCAFKQSVKGSNRNVIRTRSRNHYAKRNYVVLVKR